MPAHLIYETVAAGELPRGSFFTLKAGVRAETGSLVLALVNGCLVVGRWFPGVAGLDWLLQPARLIRIAARALITILGVVEVWPSLI